MVQNEHFKFGTTKYPLTTGSPNNILFDGDNSNYRLLQFYSNILQLNLGARWVESCAACGLTQANFPNITDGYIVGNSIAYPPKQTLMETDYKFPLLSVYRAKQKNIQFTTTKTQIESDYRVTFTLPPLSTTDMYNHLYPYLEEATRVIAFYTFTGSDPKYNNGELVLKEANIDYALMEGADFGDMEGIDKKTFYPTVIISMKVYEQNHFVPEDFTALLGIDGYISNVDGYAPNDPYTNPTFNTINNLQFEILSISQTEGPVSGGQLIVLTGNGFASAGLTQNIQITLAGNMCQTFTIKSNNLMLVYTAAAASIATGPIVLTDQNGFTATSSQNYSFI